MTQPILPPLLREGTEGALRDLADRKNLEEMYIRQGTDAWERKAGDDELDPERLRRSALTYGELLDQPKMIRLTLELEADAIREAGERLAKKDIRRIVMVGCGDSIAALRGTRSLLEEILGFPCEECEALDFAYYYGRTVDEHTLVVALSASGETIRIVECLMTARERGAQTLALSNTPGSTLMQCASERLLIHASRKGWPTQSSTCAMAMMIAVGFALAEASGKNTPRCETLAAAFAQIPDLIGQTIVSSEAWAKEMAKILASEQMVLFVGGGPFFTCAEYGAAKVKECTPARSIAIPLEEYHHYNSQKAGDHLILIAPAGKTDYRALETEYTCKSCGGYVHVITTADEQALIAEADSYVTVPQTEECLQNFLCAIPAQLLGYRLSEERERIARAEARK